MQQNLSDCLIPYTYLLVIEFFLAVQCAVESIRLSDILYIPYTHLFVMQLFLAVGDEVIDETRCVCIYIYICKYISVYTYVYVYT